MLDRSEQPDPNTEMSATMTKQTKPETKHLSLTVPVATFDALQDYRHDKRIDRTGPAAVEFIESGLIAEGYLSADTEAPAE